MSSNSIPLPEKVLQFGTGILLRGLPDYFIDKANLQGIFNGSILVVKSTPGSTEEFGRYNNRYAICVRGLLNGKEIEENTMNSAISRVLTAQSDWPLILSAAANPVLQVILSNTTEVGIRFVPESVFQSPPSSFPGKLTAVLYERFKTLGKKSPPIVVLPTELLPDNGKILYDIVMRLSAHNNLGEVFTAWLARHAVFCNSLVDRIVTRPSEAVQRSMEGSNSLTLQAEPYKLWAIEGDEQVKKVLTFAAADPGVIISDSIGDFRERKLRLLNGTHTVTSCLGFLTGLDTVYDCMQDKEMSAFVGEVMLNEIEPTLPPTARESSRQFALDVLDRFRNPFTVHRLLSITLQSTAKMKMRNIPTLLRYVKQFNTLPDLLVQGFAAYVLFMKATRKEENGYFGSRNGEPYVIQDDHAGYFFEAWRSIKTEDRSSLQDLVEAIARNGSLWDTDLTALPGFVESVTGHLEKLIRRTTR